MNTHVQQLWIDALPHYEQATATLRKGNAFCVGGVLCDLHSQATGFRWAPAPIDPETLLYLGAGGFVPPEVLMWAQLHEDDFLPLQDANDSGVPFTELAKRIAAL